MSYVSVRKPCRRHGYEGNYRRSSQNVSPPCRELDHMAACDNKPGSGGGKPQDGGHACPCVNPDLSCCRSSAGPDRVVLESSSVTHECEVSRTLSLTRTVQQRGDTLTPELNAGATFQDVQKHRTTGHERDSLENNNQVLLMNNNNSSLINNNVTPTKLQDSLSKAQLNRINAQHQAKRSSVAVPRPQELKSQQGRDAYIVVSMDLEPETPDRNENSEKLVQPSSSLPVLTSQKQQATSHETELPEMEVTLDESRSSARKWESSRDQTSKDDELDQLSRSYAERCGDQTLRNILVPGPDQVQLWDYMQGVFSKDDLLSRGKDTARHKRQQQQDTKEDNSPNNNSNSIQQAPLDNRALRESPQGRLGSGRGTALAPSSAGNSELPAHSAYFTTSEPKAKLLTRLSQTDLLNGQACTSDSELGRKKEELIGSISRKLTLLRAEQLGLQEEVSQNEKLGRDVAWKVEAAAKPNELQKYRLHVEETEKILNLLMSLSGRLARAQNALRALSPDADPDERHLLEAKRDKLSSQHEEARALKESLDRRGRQVEAFLQTYLSEEEFGDYLHFVAMKAKLLVDARELDEKIRLGEEQLAALERRVTTGVRTDSLRSAAGSDWARNTGATSV